MLQITEKKERKRVNEKEEQIFLINAFYDDYEFVLYPYLKYNYFHIT